MAGSSLRSFEYLESLPGTVFLKLYQQPSTALAIFRRMLPHLGKTLVMTMLYISRAVPVGELEAWIRPNCKRERDEAVTLLERLHILKANTTPGKARAYVLTQPFAQSLRQALTGGGQHKSFGMPCDTPASERVSIADLDQYARHRWEGVLGYMVSSAEGVTMAPMHGSVSDSVKKLLQDGGLVRARGKATITTEGFAFVLQEVNAQVWTILIYYLEAAEEMNMDPVDVLSFLFTLGSLELGQNYSKANLSPTQMQMLEDLTDFGLVFQSRDSPDYFYPTRLATTLTSDSNALRRNPNSGSATAGLAGSAARGDLGEDASQGAGGGFIVVETNYRLYAYTTSALQIAILQLFARLSTRYPNMVAGKITRESIRRAVSLGITSDQIISYLATHAHPQMRKAMTGATAGAAVTAGPLPPTVVDQIRLWQIEGERMQATPGYLFKDFAYKDEYEACRRYAHEIGVLIWSQDDHRMFFVTRVEQVAAFLKNRPKRAAG